ncbi:MAG: hypothetical protein M1817_004997 [Caeruleum heppii]|nr:MAG: hypothetical protein M1817_004997 [Caeruleum heppii]
MAAPPQKTIKDLTGDWVMNKTLSDPTDPILQMQHIGWFLRKAIGLATVTLHIKQYKAPASESSPPITSTSTSSTNTSTPTSTEMITHIDITQTATGGIQGTTELRTLDDQLREHTDHIFGKLRGRSRFVTVTKEVQDPFLKEGWLEETATKEGGAVRAWSESVDSDWTAEQVWGFEEVEGKRRYVRHVVVTNKQGERKVARLVYDFLET